jgi:hypothetical protein
VKRPARSGCARGQTIHRLEDVPAATVVGGDRERQPGVRLRQSLALLDETDESRIEWTEIADDAQPDLILVELRHLLLECPDEELHQERHFVGGRRQFSLEKANRVRYSTPKSTDARTTSRTASTPRL